MYSANSFGLSFKQNNNVRVYSEDGKKTIMNRFQYVEPTGSTNRN